MSKLITSDIE